MTQLCQMKIRSWIIRAQSSLPQGKNLHRFKIRWDKFLEEKTIESHCIHRNHAWLQRSASLTLQKKLARSTEHITYICCILTLHPMYHLDHLIQRDYSYVFMYCYDCSVNKNVLRWKTHILFCKVMISLRTCRIGGQHLWPLFCFLLLSMSSAQEIVSYFYFWFMDIWEVRGWSLKCEFFKLTMDTDWTHPLASAHLGALIHFPRWKRKGNNKW